MWRDKKVSVIFPTYNEKESIYSSIIDFFASGYVDEVVVVNNNAAPGTDEEVKKTPAQLVYENQQGYGYAIRCGFKQAKGDIVIISEPDGTFEGKDVVKLLAYSDDFPVVFGTRTTSILIWSGANMGWLLRAGNILVAKLIEFLFDTTTLTDVGCTMKLFKKEALRHIENQFTIGGSHFGPELMILTILNGIRFIEIPVNYKKRVGVSSVTGNKIVAFFLGFRMIMLILKYRFNSWVGFGK
jgi:glycosyltransferase involved in cell wall biosynthesis